jgi:dienelactone hydrolase
VHRALRTAAAFLALALVGGACGDDDEGASPSTTAAAPTTTAGSATAPFALDRLDLTVVDTTRATPSSGEFPGAPERTIDLQVTFPVGAEAPLPLLVFSHGLGGSPEYLRPITEAWAAAGFVVAAPFFPLSRTDAPGGPDAGDVQNQTGDVGFVIDSVLAEADDDASPLAGLVDGDRIGAAGHSNGAITTLGATLHTCCRDDRIDAAIAMAGTANPFDGGSYDWTSGLPYLVVHGTEDALVSYANAPDIYNRLVGPKGLLTIEGGDHGSWFAEDGDGHAGVVSATTDFWLAQLTGDEEALARLQAGTTGEDGVALVYEAESGAPTTVPTTTIAVDRQVNADTTSGLTDGQVVTVTWSGFLPGGTINVVQCSAGGTGGAGFCDLTIGRILQPNPTGAGSIELEIIVGPVGEGSCGPGVTDCVIIVNDSGLTEPDATIHLPLEFAG